MPVGNQIGTDSPTSQFSDHTNFGIVYDHLQKIVYWRTEANPSLQRLRLGDILAGVAFLPVVSNPLPFFADAAHALQPGAVQ